jgi:hypothetical protein
VPFYFALLSLGVSSALPSPLSPQRMRFTNPEPRFETIASGGFTGTRSAVLAIIG